MSTQDTVGRTAPQTDEDGLDALGAAPIALVAAAADKGERLDRFLAKAVPALSRTRLKALVQEGRVTMGGKVVDDPGRKVEVDVPIVVDVPPPEPAEPAGEDIPLAVVHEDDQLLVLDKPAGLVVHPAAGHDSGTLVNALIAHCGDSLSGIGGVRRPGIVHRLDKDTSGLMVVAKSDRAHASLIRQWGDRSVGKHYLALVDGVVEPDEGTIDAAIGRDPANRQRMAVLRGGKEAVTHFTVLRRFADATLLDVQIETGRTHQIRVHLAFIGHPVLGDQTYGGKTGKVADRAPRQFLHASRLEFALPDGTPVVFSSALPADLEGVLAGLTPV